MLHTALLTLKYIFRDELRDRLAEILGLLRDLAQSSNGLDYVRTLLRYLAQAVSIDRWSGGELRQAVTQTLSGGGELIFSCPTCYIIAINTSKFYYCKHD
jgi:hypothetical protein